MECWNAGIMVVKEIVAYSFAQGSTKEAADADLSASGGALAGLGVREW